VRLERDSAKSSMYTSLCVHQGEVLLSPRRLLGIAVRILQPGLRRPAVDGLRLSEGSQQLSDPHGDGHGGEREGRSG